MKSPPYQQTSPTINQQQVLLNTTQNSAVTSAEAQFNNITKYKVMIKEVIEVFQDLSDKEKTIAIEKYMKGITQRWKDDYE